MSKQQPNEFKSVGQAIRQLLNSYHLTSKFDEARVIEAWGEFAGKPIASRTRKIYIRNKVLFVMIDSPSLKNDFALHKTAVLQLFKEEFGNGIIEDIVVM